MAANAGWSKTNVKSVGKCGNGKSGIITGECVKSRAIMRKSRIMIGKRGIMVEKNPKITGNMK
jgi:hypothetical protein